ncbi:hypothetical protein HAX54_038754, partial [Datura stramonium]|nr:hypothetical protein [Datura stramonium]
MAPKSSKGKGVASSSQGTMRARMSQEAPMDDVACHSNHHDEFELLALYWWKDGHDIDGSEYHMTFPYAMSGRQNVVKNYLWLLGAWKVEEEVDYKPRYDPKGLEVIKTKDRGFMPSLVLSISEKNG